MAVTGDGKILILQELRNRLAAAQREVRNLTAACDTLVAELVDEGHDPAEVAEVAGLEQQATSPAGWLAKSLPKHIFDATSPTGWPREWTPGLVEPAPRQPTGEELASWLTGYMAQAGGAAPASEVVAACREQTGLALPAALYAIRRKLGIGSIRRDGAAWWTDPSAGGPEPTLKERPRPAPAKAKPAAAYRYDAEQDAVVLANPDAVAAELLGRSRNSVRNRRRYLRALGVAEG